MSNFQLSVLCLVITLGIYFANKRLYRRFRKLPLMPLVLTPALLVLMLVFGHISWQNYIGESHWLLWLLGPATIAFAVPVYDNLAVIKRHWMSLTAGVITATLVAVTSSVWLARLFMLPDEIQRSLAVRSVTTPFALAAAEPLGGQPDLVALFVVVTGVFGMAAMCCFYAFPFVKEWRKAQDLALHRMAQARRALMSLVSKRAWLPVW